MNKVIYLLLCATLVGCGGKAKFDCPYSSGVSCVSVSEVDDLIKQGNYAGSSSITKKKDKSIKYVPQNINTSSASNPPIRTNEVVLQMWVAPYETTDGLYYQQSFMNVVVKQPEWIRLVMDDLTEK